MLLRPSNSRCSRMALSRASMGLGRLFRGVQQIGASFRTFVRNFVKKTLFVLNNKPNNKQSTQIACMDKHLETRAMFAGYRPSDAQMAVKPPMHPASTFVFPDARTGAAHMETAYGIESAETPPDGFIYSRLGNPTVAMAEQRLAAWDDSQDAFQRRCWRGRGRVVPFGLWGRCTAERTTSWTRCSPQWGAR